LRLRPLRSSTCRSVILRSLMAPGLIQPIPPTRSAPSLMARGSVAAGGRAGRSFLRYGVCLSWISAIIIFTFLTTGSLSSTRIVRRPSAGSGGMTPFHRGNVPYREPEVAARYGGAAPRREILRAFHEPQTGSSPLIGEPIARLPERERVRRFEGVDPDRNEFVARRSLPGLQGVNPDRRTFVQRGAESRDRGEGVPSQAEHGYSIRMLAPEWARRSARLPPVVGGRWEASLSGSNVRQATSPSGGILGGGFRAQ
jgi:hypothetical protein